MCVKKERSTVYERLSVLVDQGYLVKLYDKSYRFRQRPAIYYLSSAGIRYLRKVGVERTQLHYKNKHFTDEQIDEQLLLGELARAARKPHSDKFGIFTKYQLGVDHFYLAPPPYAKLSGDDDSTPDYFLEYFPAYHSSWKIKKRINQHVNRADEAENKGYTYPHLLLVCGNQSTEKRVVSMTAGMYSEFEILTTTSERLLAGSNSVWLKPYEVDWDEELEYYGLPLEYET